MIDDIIKDFSEKLEAINKKLDILKNDGNSGIEVLSTNDIMSILRINRNQANELFKRADFPKIKGIKSNKVERTAFKSWLQNNEKMKGAIYLHNVIQTLISKREEEITLTTEEQEKILQESKIYLNDIIKQIDDENIQLNLLKYEEQNNRINSKYDELFYKRGFKDALTLL